MKTLLRILSIGIILTTNLTCSTTSTLLPDLPTLDDRITHLHETLSSIKEDSPQAQTTRHEIHRLLFVTYLLNAESRRQNARISAHHAFSKLYHCQCLDQLAMRDVLCRFVADLYELRSNHPDSRKHANAILARCCQLEEAIVPLLKHSERGQDALHAFTTQMYRVVTNPRITRKHMLMFVGGALLSITLTAVVWQFLSKMVETEEKIGRGLQEAKKSSMEVLQELQREHKESMAQVNKVSSRMLALADCLERALGKTPSPRDTFIGRQIISRAQRDFNINELIYNIRREVALDKGQSEADWPPYKKKESKLKKFGHWVTRGKFRSKPAENTTGTPLAKTSSSTPTTPEA